MQSDDFFEAIGKTTGHAIRLLVDALGALLDMLSLALSDFLNGLAKAVGIDNSITSLVLLAIGLFLLYKSLRAFMRKALISGIVWLALGLLMMRSLMP